MPGHQAKSLRLLRFSMHWWLGQWTSWSKTSWRDRWCRHRMSWCFSWISWSRAWSLWAFAPLMGLQLGCMSYNERILDHTFMLYFVLGTGLCIKLTQTSISKHCISLSLWNLQLQGPLALVSPYRSSRMFCFTWTIPDIRFVHINTIEFFEFRGAQLAINWIAIYFASPGDAQISWVCSFLQATWVANLLSKNPSFSWKKSCTWFHVEKFTSFWAMMPSGAGFLSSTAPTVCFEDGQGLCDLMTGHTWRNGNGIAKRGILKLQVGINIWTRSWTPCLRLWSNNIQYI